VAIYDLSDPYSPVAMSRAETNGIAVLDVRNPAVPRLAGTIETQYAPSSVTVTDGLILVTYLTRIDFLLVTELPQLWMERAGNEIRLTWKTEPGLILQRNSTLGSDQWEAVALAAGTSEIIVGGNSKPSFCRLRRNQ
jgi:hypothetical protein